MLDKIQDLIKIDDDKKTKENLGRNLKKNRPHTRKVKHTKSKDTKSNTLFNFLRVVQKNRYKMYEKERPERAPTVLIK